MREHWGGTSDHSAPPLFLSLSFSLSRSLSLSTTYIHIDRLASLSADVFLHPTHNLARADSLADGGGGAGNGGADGDQKSSHAASSMSKKVVVWCHPKAVDEGQGRC